MRKKRKQSVPLIIEEHPKEYDGYPFITLIQYRQEHILSIIDNYCDKEIRAFVLDMCAPAGINEELVISIAGDWYSNHKHDYPLSFEFSRRDVSSIVSPIYKKFNIDYVSRIIGPVYSFPMNTVEKIKRKRKKNIPVGVKITKNSIG